MGAILYINIRNMGICILNLFSIWKIDFLKDFKPKYTMAEYNFCSPDHPAMQLAASRIQPEVVRRTYLQPLYAAVLGSFLFQVGYTTPNKESPLQEIASDALVLSGLALLVMGSSKLLEHKKQKVAATRNIARNN
jgi:hypothetical protein